MNRPVMASAVVLALLTIAGTSGAQDPTQVQRADPPPPAAPSPQTAVPRESAPPPAPAPAPRGESATSRSDSSSRGGDPGMSQRIAERSSSRGSDERVSSGQAVQAPSRPRGDRPSVGRAVPREDAPGGGDTRLVFVPRIAPYNYGYGAFGLGYFYYDPFGWGSYGYGYPGYGNSGYGYGYPSGYSSSYQPYPTGGLRLKVKPREAQVFVDGYYVGLVNDFDGVFQRLNLETGPHRIEIRADSYEPLVFEVRIQFDETITYRGVLIRR